MVSVAPDAASVIAFGPDLYDSASWNPAYQAGLAQAATVADEVGARWIPDPQEAMGEYREMKAVA